MLDGKLITAAIRAALRERSHGVAFAMTRQVGALIPGGFLLETEAHEFAIERFANAGHCKLTPLEGMTSQTPYVWSDRSFAHVAVAAWAVEWPASPEPLHCISVTWGAGDCNKFVRYVLAPRRADAEALFTEVCRWNDDLAGSVLVFDRGNWEKSRAMRAEIARTHAEDLVLPAQLRDEIIGDLQRFLDRKTEYDRLGVPWKRGVLLSGPPGNGKTMCIKLLANTLRATSASGEKRPIDALYVRSLVSRGWPEHYTIGMVFERARRHKPCLLIFEDLDALVTAENRSVFLNELDGLAVNSGIIVVASTNHAERLDPALRNRPSRFDRKWSFGLPAVAERQRFLVQWNERATDEVRLAPQTHGSIAELTDGFSFAYLKELLLSATMRWIDEPTRSSLADVVLHQVAVLRDQMSETAKPPGANGHSESAVGEDHG